ncbi:MAG: hypothetical protein M3250_07795 [Thermoproteota archaeon]|nr:hypothetical protein [Thermoproteota archaeon]
MNKNNQNIQQQNETITARTTAINNSSDVEEIDRLYRRDIEFQHFLFNSNLDLTLDNNSESLVKDLLSSKKI